MSREPIRTLLLAAGLAAAFVAPPARGDEAGLRWEIPGPDARFAEPELLVAGSVATAEAAGTDLVLLVDVSESMSQPSGFDLDGDGVVGRDGVAALFGGRDADDDLLSLARRLAAAVLDGLDARRDRAALVTFAGPVPHLRVSEHAQPPDAVVHAGLGTPLAATRKGLEALAGQTPRGRTNLARGVELGLDLLETAAAPKRRLVLLVLSDGEITAPGEIEDHAAGWQALDALLPRVTTLGATLQVLALGRPPGRSDRLLERRVAALGGGWRAVRHPDDLGAMGEGLQFTDVERVEILNLTRDEGAEDPWLGPAGRFAALVKLAPGWNRILVRAIHRDGRVEEQQRRVEFRPGVEAAAPNGWTPLRAQMHKRRWLRVEAQRIERVRRSRTAKQVEVGPLPEVSAGPAPPFESGRPAPSSR